MKEYIAQAIEETLAELGAADVSFNLERPGDFSHGDYATNAALVAAKQLGQKPTEVASMLYQKLISKKSLSETIDHIEIAGPGFINFFLSHKAVTTEVGKIATHELSQVASDFNRKVVLVEYTSPNLFKPLHIGNLIGNILGESITRILELSGAEVKRINYPSDIGLTVAKGVWGIQKNALDPNDILQLGQAYVLGNTGYEENESAKKEIEEINKALYGGDAALTQIREVGINTSLRHLESLCRSLGTTFDVTFFESQAAPIGQAIVLENLQDGIFEPSDGAIVFKGEQMGLHTRVFLNSHGLPTYEAKDIGLFALKQKAYPTFDASITVTGSEQKEYFKVIFAAIKKVFPQTEGKLLEHIANGFLRLTTGKMSSRKGNVITGESLLADLKSIAKEKMQGRALKGGDEIAEQIAVGAIKYAVLKQGKEKDITFDPEKSLSLEGDSGPYLQYAHTRAKSLQQKAKEAGISIGYNSITYDEHFAEEIKTHQLGRLLIHFPEVVSRAATELEPHYITTFLTELASQFNSWYATERVIDGKHPAYMLVIVKAVQQTLSKGLYLLGIPVPEEM